MRFSRVATTMEAMEKKQLVTLNDALNLFQDLCEDIKDDQNVTADRLPAGDEDEAVTRLAWMCRTIVRMAGQLPVESIDRDRMQRLEKVEENVARISEQLEGVSAGLITLKGKEEQLRTTESQLEEALRKDKALKEECDRLEAVIREYREMKAPDLRTRKERLAQEKATLLSEYDALLNQCDQQEEDNTAYRDKICEQKARCETLKNTFAQMKENLEKLEEKYQQQQERYQELKDQLQRTDTSRRSLVEQIENLEQSLSRTDMESLRQLLGERTIEVQAREQEQKQMEDEIRQKEEALERLKETLGEKNKRAQEITWASEAEEKKARTSLELLETRMREAEARKQELLSQTVLQEKEAEQLEEWFRGLEAENYKDRLKNSQERLKILKTAQENLEDDLQYLQGLARKDAEDKLREYREYFRDSIEKIANELDQYQKSYLIVTNIFENGGNGL